MYRNFGNSQKHGRLSSYLVLTKSRASRDLKEFLSSTYIHCRFLIKRCTYHYSISSLRVLSLLKKWVETFFVHRSWAFLITCRPSSFNLSVCSSVCLSVCFHIFDVFFRTTGPISTKRDTKRPLLFVFFLKRTL